MKKISQVKSLVEYDWKSWLKKVAEKRDRETKNKIFCYYHIIQTLLQNSRSQNSWNGRPDSKPVFYL